MTTTLAMILITSAKFLRANGNNAPLFRTNCYFEICAWPRSHLACLPGEWMIATTGGKALPNLDSASRRFMALVATALWLPLLLGTHTKMDNCRTPTKKNPALEGHNYWGRIVPRRKTAKQKRLIEKNSKSSCSYFLLRQLRDPPPPPRRLGQKN